MELKIIKDQMTSLERMKAFAKGEPIDRMPCKPHMGVTLAPFIGKTTYEHYHSPEVMADLEVALYRKLGQDGVGAALCLRSIAEALGTKVHYPKSGVSYVEKPVLEDIKDVSKLSPVNPYKDGSIPMRLKALKLIKERIGHEVGVGFAIAGPFTAAADVVGTEKYLKALRKNPEKVHELLEIVTESNLRVIDAAAEIGASISIMDPVSSTSLISTKLYREFSMPYLKTCVDRIKEKTGKGASIHICGKSKELWEYIVEVGIGSLSLDNAEDLEEAKNMVGDRICIVGNVSPVDTIYNSTYEAVLKESKECIKKAYDNKKGFMLSSGCQVPLGSPIENVQALMDAARSYGAYPYNPALWD